MTVAIDPNARPLPDFQRWLDETSPGTKAPDFADFADLARRTRTQDVNHLAPHERAFVRMLSGAMIAAVEICNAEVMTHGEQQHDVIVRLPRVFACAIMYALASAMKRDTNFRQIAKVTTEEFSAAAKMAADQLSEQNAGPNPAHVQHFPTNEG
jgi:hypothetical protein